MRRGIRGLLGAAFVVALALPAASPAAAGSRFVNWSAYLFGPRHPSIQGAATAITPANAAGVTAAWNWTPPPAPPGYPNDTLAASPTVYKGTIFIGTNDGDEYALDEATGRPLWHYSTGVTANTPCPARGIVSTATVAKDPVTHRPTVYFGAADGYLYALNAADGNLTWRSQVVTPSPTVNDYYLWASPTVANGKIYIGMSSMCDKPLIRGGVRSFDQATGDPIATYYTVPDGAIGGSVWSSEAVGGKGKVFVTTGNEDPNGTEPGDSVSIVRLDGTTLEREDLWTVPPSERAKDADFGGSPTLFTADIGGNHPASLVGACNKIGVYFVWRASNLRKGPVWSYRVNDQDSGPCIAAAIWDGSHLVVGGTATTIGDTLYGGSVQELDAGTGAVVWQTGLPGYVLGSPTEDGAGVIGVGTYDMTGNPNAAYLLDASTGEILTTLPTNNAKVFGQVVFADQYVFVAATNGLTAYTPASG